MSIYNATVPQVSKMLRNLDAWLVKAEVHAEAVGFSVDNLVSARLAPDQFPLGWQIGTAADNAKLMVARLTGLEAPKHADDQTTVAELRARIASVLEFLGSVGEDAFAESKSRTITLHFIPGMGMTAAEYLNAFALPNFYFHISHCYAILRHNGVPLGKMDYIGGLDLFPVISES